MRNTIILILIGFSMIFSWSSYSQSNKLKRAYKNYKNLDYKRAILLYQKAYKKNDINCCNDDIAAKIANCYRLIGETKNAECWYKKVVENENTDKVNYIYYAQMLQINGKYNEAKKWLHKHSESLGKNELVTNFLLDENIISSMKKEELKFEINLLPINSTRSDIGPAFYENNLVFLSARDTFSMVRNSWDNEPFFDIYTSEIDSIGEFQKVTKFSKKLNSPYHEGPLCFHPKYDYIYFTRSNKKKSSENNVKISRLSIYKAIKGKKGWTDIKKLWFNAPEYSCVHPTISPDGLVLIFSSDKEGGYGGMDLYFSFWNDTAWSEPINLGNKINTAGSEVFPYFAPDGKLYFSSNGRKGLGGLDVYFTFPSFEDIKEIKNVGIPINSTHDDFGFIKDKNDKGYFVSNRPSDKFGKDNIYSFTTYYYPKLTNDTLEIPTDVMLNEKVSFNILENKIKEKGNHDIESIEIITEGRFAKEFMSNNDGEFTYWVNKSFKGIKKIDYVVTNKRGLKDTASIYLVMEGNTPPSAKADWLYAVKNGKGRVIDVLRNDYDKENNIMIDSVKIIQYPKKGGELIQERRYVYYMPPKNFVGKDYCIYQIRDTRGGMDTDTIFLQVVPEFMGKLITTGRELDLSIHFKYNRWRIDFLERKKLDRIAVFLTDNPSVLSQVTGHTDPIGTSTYNMALSKRRANATASYLSLKGIKKNRLKIKGKGESDLIYKNLKSMQKGDPKNTLNRRTTIKVLEY